MLVKYGLVFDESVDMLKIEADSAHQHVMILIIFFKHVTFGLEALISLFRFILEILLVKDGMRWGNFGTQFYFFFDFIMHN